MAAAFLEVFNEYYLIFARLLVEVLLTGSKLADEVWDLWSIGLIGGELGATGMKL